MHANATVLTSLYEGYPNVLIESITMNTPVVAFDKTGVSEIVKHKENGYLAEFMNEKDLANGIEWVLKFSDQKLLFRNSRKRVENHFSEEVIIKKYQNLYNKFL